MAIVLPTIYVLSL